jgi:hypothetical protein
MSNFNLHRRTLDKILLKHIQCDYEEGAKLLNDTKIRELYRPLNLEDALLDKVIEAHNIVLKAGQSDGNEHAVTICCDTNTLKRYTSGKQRTVSLLCNPDKKYFTIHNHPENLPFSPRDLYSFYEGLHHKYLTVQGHNGITYVLYRESNNITTISFNEINELFDRVRDAPVNKDLSQQKIKEISVFLIARKLGWVFFKGEVA